MMWLYNAGTGDMAELVECARLEIAYTGNCIEGSNPPISAIIKFQKSTTGGFFNFTSGDWGMCANASAAHNTQMNN